MADKVTPNQAANTESVSSRNPSSPRSLESRCTANEFAELESELSELLGKFTEKHPKVVQLREVLDQKLRRCTYPPTAPPLGARSGKWHEKGGKMVCDGYLTRFADEDFCSATPPEDWTKFEFNGVEYFFEPLSSSADK